MFPLTRDRSRNRSAFGYRPTLNLIFGPNSGDTLDPRITFSRTSNATQFDSSGNLVYAPHNLLTQSESFDNAAWSKTNVTVVPNAAAAPDGTLTADELTATAADCTIGRYGSATTAGVLHIGSIYLRANTSTSVRIYLIDAGGGSGADFTVCNVTTAWQRFYVQRTTSAGTTAIGFQIGGASTFSTGEVIQAWGAQLNIGTLQPYYPTTVKNALGYSQEFDNAAWTKTASSISATKVAAPDGSLTGQKLVENTANASHFASQAFTATNVTVTFSAYMKAGERTFGRMQLSNFATGAAQAVFNLSNGTIHVAAVAGGDFTLPVASIIPVGNGWYRCSLTAVKGSTNSTIGCTLVLDNGATNIYTGDGTSGIFIWGAQLSDSASLDPYVYNPVAAPTAAAYYGPRFDYDPATLEARGLLIEEQRTNSIRNNSMVGAVAGTPGTFPTNWSVSVAGGLSREVVGSGIVNGINYLDLRVFGTTTNTNLALNLYFEAATQVAAVSGQQWSESVWVQVIGGSTSGISQTFLTITEISSAGADLAYLSGTNFISTAGNFTRRIYTNTTSNVSTAFVRPALWVSHTGIGAAIDFTLRIGLPQLELGAFATSVIPTTTAAATRTADNASMIGANFSNWCNQNEGTLFADLSNFTRIAATFPRLVSLVGTDANADEISIYTRGLGVNAGQAFGSITVAGVNTFDPGIVSSAVDTWKAAIAYRTNDAAFGVSGQVSATDTAVTLPVTVAMRICGAVRFQPMPSAWVRRIAYFPRRLANSELQTVTL